MSFTHRVGARAFSGRDDRGSVSLLFVVVAIGMLVAVGLVVDGGGKIRALQRADAAATEAARQGGQSILAGPAIRGQGAQADVAQAQAAAEDYLAAAGIEGTVTVVGGTRIQVQTTTTYEPVFLSIVGVGTITATGEAEARLVRSLDGEQ